MDLGLVQKRINEAIVAAENTSTVKVFSPAEIAEYAAKLKETNHE
jgi:hypothetical protein